MSERIPDALLEEIERAIHDFEPDFRLVANYRAECFASILAELRERRAAEKRPAPESPIERAERLIPTREWLIEILAKHGAEALLDHAMAEIAARDAEIARLTVALPPRLPGAPK